MSLGCRYEGNVTYLYCDRYQGLDVGQDYASERSKTPKVEPLDR